MAEEAIRLAPVCTLAAELDCGRAGRFRSEVYEVDAARTGIKRYWHLRWLVEFLGGTDVPNFIGNLVPVLRNKVVERMDPLWSGDPDALVEKAKTHVLDSSWSSVQEKAQQHRTGAKRKEAERSETDPADDPADDAAARETTPDKAVATACRETCCSTLALAVLLLHWACNMRSNMKWNLEADDVKSRCRDVLRGLSHSFFAQAVAGDNPPFYINIADGRLDKQALLQQGGGRVFQSLQAQEGRWMDVADVLIILVGEDKNRAFGLNRRKRARMCIARVLEILLGQVESSSIAEHMVWNKVQVKQLEQMRRVQKHCRSCCRSVIIPFKVVLSSRFCVQDGKRVPSGNACIQAGNVGWCGMRGPNSAGSGARSGAILRERRRCADAENAEEQWSSGRSLSHCGALLVHLCSS